MTLLEAYIWLDKLIEYCKKDLLPDAEIESLELCKRMIMEKFTGYSDEKVYFFKDKRRLYDELFWKK
jgi:hypothetical protein